MIADDRPAFADGVTGLRELLADPTIDAQGIAARLIERIAAHETLHAFVRFDRERAQDAARRADAHTGSAGALHGVPIAIKDNIDVAGLPTSAGNAALAARRVSETAPAVQRVLDAGGWVIGKANMHELAFGVTSRNATFGEVRNPLDVRLSAGGSSGGCAAALAAGLAPLALGTDTGGSARIPAAFCGVVGFRPSTGRYPGSGVVPLAASRDVVAPMAVSVADAALLDQIIAGGESLAAPDPAALRIGIPDGFLTEDLDAVVASAFDAARARMTKAGVTIQPVALPGLWELIDRTSLLITRYELRRDFAGAILARAPGMSAAEFIAAIASPDVRQLFEMTLDDRDAPTAAAYEEARQVLLPRMRKLLARAFSTHGIDALAFPTVPVAPFPLTAGREVLVNGTARPLFLTTVRNLQQASLAGLPSISLPMPGAAPCGLCLEALPGQDRTLLSIAAAVESALR